jgi:hypothetical protein
MKSGMIFPIHSGHVESEKMNIPSHGPKVEEFKKMDVFGQGDQVQIFVISVYGILH